MSSEGFAYQLDSGEYVIEGFEFSLAGDGGQVTIVPNSYLAPQLGLKIVAFREGFRGQVEFYAPLSVLAKLRTDLEKLLLSDDDGALLFPSSERVRFLMPQFDCRIDGRSRKWTMYCRCGAPMLWNRDVSPEFGAMIQLMVGLERSSLENLGFYLAEFLRWFDRQGFLPSC